MNPDDLARILDELGQRLGPTGEYVFALAVRQVVVSSTLWLIVSGLIALIGLVTLLVCAYVVIKDTRQADFNEGPFNVGVLALIALLAGVVVASTCIVPLLNPEYAALRDILSAIGAGR